LKEYLEVKVIGLNGTKNTVNKMRLKHKKAINGWVDG